MSTTADIRFRETFHTELNGVRRPCLDVFAGDRYLGQVMQVHHTLKEGDRVVWEDMLWWAKPAGAPWFFPTVDGLRMTAVQAVEQAADLPSGYRRKSMPEELRITKISDGAVLKPADGVSEE